MISKVKFYPIETNRGKNCAFILSIWYPFKEGSLIQTAQIKTTMLELKTAINAR